MSEPLPVQRIEIRAVQFVGTNVEMTYLVDAPDGEAEPRLEALLQAKLGLYALTATGRDDGRARFSVLASPLDRLFHKIGPPTALTTIKHASVTLDLSETHLARQAQGLLTTYPTTEPYPETWRPWDVGKLLGTCLRRPHVLRAGTVEVAGEAVREGVFPHAILGAIDAHAAEHGGVRVVLPAVVRDALQG